MRYITLTKGAKAIIDDADFEKAAKYKWYCSSMGYATRTEYIDGIRKEILLHRFLLGAKSGQEIDHINRNPLDNRRGNLRFCSRSENNHNRGVNKNNKSGYTGVYWHKGAKKWLAQIMLDRKRINIGLFDDPLLAHKQRQNYAKTI